MDFFFRYFQKNLHACITFPKINMNRQILSVKICEWLKNYSSSTENNIY